MFIVYWILPLAITPATNHAKWYLAMKSRRSSKKEKQDWETKNNKTENKTIYHLSDCERQQLKKKTLEPLPPPTWMMIHFIYLYHTFPSALCFLYRFQSISTEWDTCQIEQFHRFLSSFVYCWHFDFSFCQHRDSHAHSTHPTHENMIANAPSTFGYREVIIFISSLSLT